MPDNYLTLLNGKPELVGAADSSAGVANAGDIVALDGTGKIPLNMLPTGVGPDLSNLPTSEDLSAGDYVNIFDVGGGVFTARLADSTNGRPAHGFVKVASTTPGPADVYFEGANDSLTGITPARYYLGAAGAAVADPPTLADGDTIHQFLGNGVSATEINTDIEDCIGLSGSA